MYPNLSEELRGGYQMSKSLPLSSRTLSLVRIGNQLHNGVISINVRLKQRGVRSGSKEKEVTAKCSRDWTVE